MFPCSHRLILLIRTTSICLSCVVLEFVYNLVGETGPLFAITQGLYIFAIIHMVLKFLLSHRVLIFFAITWFLYFLDDGSTNWYTFRNTSPNARHWPTSMESCSNLVYFTNLFTWYFFRSIKHGMFSKRSVYIVQIVINSIINICMFIGGRSIKCL